jgi:hypothetical protein
MSKAKRSAHARKAAKTPKAKHPWDLPPSMPSGNESADPIFLAVGRSLSNWEYVENRLAQVFATFVGADTGKNSVHPAVRAYGAIVGFKSRVGMLDAAAKAYFREVQIEGQSEAWNDLKKTVTGFSDRRNDIAHASAEQLFDRETEKPWGFYLMPGLYASKKYPDGEPPAYMLTAEQISVFAEEFAKLADRVRFFEAVLSGKRRVASREPRPPRQAA